MAGLLVAASPARSAARESFELAVPTPPAPVAIEGRDWLVYELHLTNFAREALRLTRVDVLLDESVVLESFGGDELAKRLAIAAVSRTVLQPVQPGERAILYVELPVGQTTRRLRHRVHFENETGDGADAIGGEVGVRARARLVLGPPLRGGPWAAVYEWEWPRGHRRVFYTLEGRARLPGRFAIDWVRKDEQGRSARGDADVVRNSLGYGADVLAVAHARVAAVRDDIAESDRLSTAPRHALDDKAGNYVALDLGDGRFAVYEHLAPGSIRVKQGERVRRGQVIAALGFTGDSTEPHLHFHVADSASPLAGEGLPFEIEWQGKRERPAPNALVSFD